MIAALLAFALLCCAPTAPGPGARQETDPAQEAPPPPAPPASEAPGERERIAGMSGVGSASSLRLVGAGEDEPALRLETNYAFPDRARWWLGRTTADRRIFYRFGARCWQLPPGGVDASEAVEGEPRTGLVGSLELRRALLLWPHGFAWSGEGDAREVDLGAPGRIVARLADGWPVELALWRGEARVEAFVDVRWRAQGEQRVPDRLRLFNGDTPVWDETFERSGPEAMVDMIFVPPDRRELPRGDTEPGEALVPLPARTTRRFALPEPLAPSAAWQAGRDVHRRIAAELPEGLALERHVALELSADGTVVAVVLRLADPPPDAPAGWSVEPARSGASEFLSGLDAVDRDAVARIARRLGRRRPGTAYAVVEVERAGKVQLVLPEAPPG